MTDPETFCRVVYEIYANRDPRDWRERPRAAAIFLSFWHHHLRQPIESLRTIIFQTVTEDTMEDLKPRIYGLMGYEGWEELDIRRRGGDPGEDAAFDLTCKETKFGRCAKLRETKNQAMKDAGIKISRFKFCPQNQSEIYFNFVVEFRGASSQQHHGGHRSRH